MYDTLFLDRDGVLNRKIENGYVLRPGDIEILPGIAGFLVTNQRCLGRQMIKSAEIEAINQLINEKTGNFIDSFFVCPHLDEDNCSCRKPKKGLFLAAARQYPVDFQRSWMVGDSETDLIPAKELMMSTVYISAGESALADITLRSTAELLSAFPAIIQTK